MYRSLALLNETFYKRILTKFGNVSKYSNGMQEQQIKIEGQTINYLKEGNGPQTILCFPGALGTIWTDFAPQIQELDKKKFTIVAWDPPGYGKSRPPGRSFTNDFYIKDADMAAKLMKELCIDKYSLLGWSDGGNSSMILSAKYPNRVQHLIIWGSNSRIFPYDITACEKIRDINSWSEKMKRPFIKLYGDEFQILVNDWLDALHNIVNEGDNICYDILPLIKCPTLILHGNQDPMIAPEHPDILLKNIKNAKIHRFPEGKHNIHLRYSQEFNAIVSRFIDENKSKM
ncbi:hypothetical protein RI129_000643 [Pyrocoelia pectoralis]|uniref:AB hydrolase-1 domain-containing protein n=1 Tax=Pyrocoelia pectoralis TaxID=417401 RepID=A0AAN7VS12_9COLE